jgi:hypothetical protein
MLQIPNSLVEVYYTQCYAVKTCRIKLLAPARNYVEQMSFSIDSHVGVELLRHQAAAAPVVVSVEHRQQFRGDVVQCQRFQ